MVFGADHFSDDNFTLLAPHDSQEQTGHLLTPPSWDPAGTVEYFSTDDLGRDILRLDGSQLTSAQRLSLPSLQRS